MPTTSYDKFKEYEGKRYTGMQVGRGHKWQYDAGQWTEKKVTPDKWEFEYSVVKRRKGRAPEGSGAPIGTAYSWYILADQIVTKLDANSYTTEMKGLKFKLAHKRAGEVMGELMRGAAEDRQGRECDQVAPADPELHGVRTNARPEYFTVILAACAGTSRPCTTSSRPRAKTKCALRRCSTCAS